MAQKNITPTKSNYITLTEDLILAKEGHGLLEQKREVLVINLTHLVFQIREARTKLDEKLFTIFSQLSLVRLESGSIILDLIVNSIVQDYEVDVLSYSVMGVVAPKLFFTEKLYIPDDALINSRLSKY